MRSRKKNTLNTRGITLAELMVTLAVLVIVLSLSLRLMGSGMLTYRYELSHAYSQLQLRQALQDMTAAVRTGQPVVLSADTLSAGERTYILLDGTLYRREPGQSDAALCHNLHTFTTTYHSGMLHLYLQAHDGFAMQSALRVAAEPEVQP